MCRFLGYWSKSGNTLPPGILDRFWELSTSGRVGPGEKLGHSEGWGAWAQSDADQFWVRRAVDLREDRLAFQRTSIQLQAFQPRVLIVHVRKSSGSSLAVQNTQPFVYREFAFCHNGTFFGTPELSAEDAAVGQSDSEQLLLALSSGLAASRLADGIRDGLRHIRGSKWTALNFLLSNGQELAAYREFDESLDRPDERRRYYEMHYGTWRGGVVVCSEQLAVPGLDWKELNRSELLIVSDGQPTVRDLSGELAQA